MSTTTDTFTERSTFWSKMADSAQLAYRSQIAMIQQASQLLVDDDIKSCRDCEDPIFIGQNSGFWGTFDVKPRNYGHHFERLGFGGLVSICYIRKSDGTDTLCFPMHQCKAKSKAKR